MPFKKKQKELDDQCAVYHMRESPRFASNGGLAIEGFEGEGLLKNVSITGCCMTSVTYAAIQPGREYHVTVIPGGNTVPFSMDLTASWTKSSETLFEAGFILKDGVRDTHLTQYVELLQNRGIRPEYGNMSPERR